MNFDKYNILIGEIINTFGHKGEVKVYPHTDFIERLSPRREVYIKSETVLPAVYKVERSRLHKNVIIVKFSGIDDMSAAENLRDAQIFAKGTDKISLQENEFYISDVIGMQVTTTAGEDLGVVTEVLKSPANDVYVTEKAMIPAVKEFVVSMNVAEKKMVVNSVEGLVQD